MENKEQLKELKKVFGEDVVLSKDNQLIIKGGAMDSACPKIPRPDFPEPIKTVDTSCTCPLPPIDTLPNQ